MLRLVALCALLLALTPLAASRPAAGKYAEAAKALHAKTSKWLLALDPVTPQQIFTARGATVTDVVITWLTMNATSSPCVTWSTEKLGAAASCLASSTSSPSSTSSSISATSRVFVDPNTDQTARYLYTAFISGVKPNTHIYYRVGSNSTTSSPSSSSMSEEIDFLQAPQGNEIHTVLVYGDLGYTNSRSVQLMTEEIAQGRAHSVLHIGDIAYNLDSEQGIVGDNYMNLMMPIASRVQYFTIQGNHENGLNATHYKERFSALTQLGIASGSGHNLWFSWNYVSGGAKIHVAAINSEQYFIDNREQARADQYKWLENDLKNARAAGVDWLIVYSHRPIYCNNLDTLSDCTVDAKRLRDGVPGENNGIDELISRYNVDIFFTAHEHDYERTQPISRGKFEMQANHTVVNAKFPITIVSGSAGCSEGLEFFDDVLFAQWSVVRSSSYGYGKLAVQNATHLHWLQYLDEGAAGTDELWLIKNPSIHNAVQIRDMEEIVAASS